MSAAPPPPPRLALLPAGAPRVALGAMRLSTETPRDDTHAAAVLAAALDAGVALVDTARAYATDDDDLGHNERLVAAAVRGRAGVAVITKGGMTRPGGRWLPDGRARAIRADAEASVAALGAPPALWLLHAPDAGVPWATSLRALAALVADGLAGSVGVSNVNRRQLDEALDLAPIAAIEVALGPYNDAAVRGGVLARALERGLVVLAHAPLGGPVRAARLGRDRGALAAAATRLGVDPATLMLAGIADLDPLVVPVAGVRRVETARALAVAGRLVLDDDARAAVRERLGFAAPGAAAAARAATAPPPPRRAGEVVMLMGVPGAGKSTRVAEWVARGHERLNRDERGGTLRGLSAALDQRLAAGATHVVLDNTFLDRAARHDFLAVAARHGVAVHGVWIDVPAEVAARRVVGRLLDAQGGRLPEPDELRRSKDPAILPPTALWRAQRAVEPPEADEGFTRLERVAAAPDRPRGAHAGLVVALDAVADATTLELRPDARARLGDAGPVLVYAWRAGPTDALAARLGAALGRAVDVAFCAHLGAGPPRCWCRPPLPGLPLAWARARDVELARSVVVGASAAARTLAAALGCTHREA